MKDRMLLGVINAQTFVRDTVSTTIGRARALADKDSRAQMERGDIVQTIIIIAMFVLICVVVGKILYDAITAQANKVGECISDSNSGKCSDFK